MGFLRPLESFIGMFQRLFGMLVSGLVIFFSVMRGGSTVGVCGEFVVFGSSLVRVAWHGVSYPWSLSILERFDFLNCTIRNTRAAATLFRIKWK
jgi:hypothetical protein